jgi:hypothetical protein
VTFNAGVMTCNKTGTDPNTGFFQKLDPEEPFFGQTFAGWQNQHLPTDFVLAAGIPSWMLQGTQLAAGSRLPGMFGYEGDHTTPRSPPSAVVWGNSPFFDYGQQRYGMATYHSATDPVTGATYQVLNVGSMNWAYGLDSAGFNMTNPPTSYENADAKQMTLNFINRLTA